MVHRHVPSSPHHYGNGVTDELYWHKYIGMKICDLRIYLKRASTQYRKDVVGNLDIHVLYKQIGYNCNIITCTWIRGLKLLPLLHYLPVFHCSRFSSSVVHF